MCAIPPPTDPFVHHQTMPASINLDDIDPQQRKQLGIRKPRESNVSKDELSSSYSSLSCSLLVILALFH
jgi:hypothetical protein